jgi:hypothetical protein
VSRIRTLPEFAAMSLSELRIRKDTRNSMNPVSLWFRSSLYRLAPHAWRDF